MIDKFICALLGCDIPEKKYHFKEFDPFISFKFVQKLLLTVITLCLGIVSFFMFMKSFFVVVYFIIWAVYAVTTLHFYLLFHYDAALCVDVTCKAHDVETVGPVKRYVQYFIDDYESIYKMYIKKTGKYPTESRFRFFLVPTGVRTSMDGMTIIPLPLCQQMLSRNVNIDNASVIYDPSDDKKKGLLSRFRRK